MSNMLTKILSSVSIASLALTGTMAANADTMSTESIVSKQAPQVVQEQDQTQFRNRQQLENRINGTGGGDHAATQQRNRYQHREQTRTGGQSMGRGDNRMQGSGAGSSGRRMAGKGGGGGRR